MLIVFKHNGKPKFWFKLSQNLLINADYQSLRCFTIWVQRRIKKPTLNTEDLSNYRPISNLSLISKITKRVVKSRLTTHLSSNNLLNPHQSAYFKHHSTETALLYIHDHLVNAIGAQQVSCLCLLDLSAATFYSLVYHPGLAFTAPS